MARDLTLQRTYAQMQALIGASLLNTQTYYKITDRGDNGLLFRAAAINRLESTGLRYMLCPATYATGADAYSNNWIGQWNEGLSVSVNDLTIRCGLVYKNLTGVVGTTSGDNDELLDNTNWVVVPKASFVNNEYTELIFGVKYDFGEDWVSKQWDDGNNYLGMAKLQHIDIFNTADFNVIDWCDWNISTYGCLFVDNKCSYIYNNVAIGIYGNIMGGGIYNNNMPENQIHSNSVSGDICLNSKNGAIWGNSSMVSEISENSNDGEIARNTNIGNISGNSITGSIHNNANLGNIFNNSGVGNIYNNANNGFITGVWDADVTDAVVDKTGTAE